MLTPAFLKPCGRSGPVNPEASFVLNPAHYCGFGIGCKEDDDFIQLCKKVLPHINLPIYVSKTGYVNQSNSEPMPDGWCTDEFGRTVISFDEYFLFARYQDHRVYLISGGGNYNDVLTEEKKKELTPRLEQKWEQHNNFIII